MRRAATGAHIAQLVMVAGVVLFAGIAAVWLGNAARTTKVHAAAATSSPLGIARMTAAASNLPEQAFDAF